MENEDVMTNDLIESYDNLSISDKRKELGSEIAELTMVVKKLLSDIAGPIPMGTLEEFDNLFDGVSSESEYLTGLYEDIINFKEILAMYLDRVTSMYYDNEEEK